MVKKICATLMAIILCLSVAFIPATAAGFDSSYELSEGKNIAYKFELDKSSYKAGDTVTLSIDLNVVDDYQLSTGTILIASNSAVIDASENDANTVKATAVGSELADSFWKPISTVTWGWQKAAIVSRVEATNTEEENQLYDQYLKFAIDRQAIGNGTHPNSDNRTLGLTGAEINADNGAMWTVQFKLRDDIPDGTPINFAITSGSITSKPAQVAFKIQSNPGVANTTKSPATSEYDVSAAVATATVGEAAPAGPVVAKSKAEVKMTPNSPTTVEDAFQFRVTSVITDADWDTYFANTAAGGINAITKLGFVAYKGTDGFDLETAKSVAKGGSAAGYDVATTTYVQKETDSSDAYFGAIIQITSAETRSDATYIAYVEYTDAEGATQYAFYDAAQTALLDTNYQTIVESYLAAYPFAG